LVPRLELIKNKTELQQLKLKSYEYDVIKLVDDFEATMVQIETKGETFSDHALCLLKAFATSHDPIFKRYVQTIKANGTLVRTSTQLF